MLIIVGPIISLSYVIPWIYVDDELYGEERSNGKKAVYVYGNIMACIMIGTWMFWIPLVISAGIASLSYVFLAEYIIRPYVD
jgi:hypothetical protein